MGSNLRRRREGRREGLRQDDLAARMRQLGLGWTRATVTAVELGTRGLTLGEAFALQLAVGWPLQDLLQIPGDLIDVEGVDVDGVVFHPDFWNKWVMQPAYTYPLLDLRGVNQRPPKLRATEQQIVDRFQLSPELVPWALADRRRATEIRLGRNLKVSPLEIACAAYARWGHGVTEERDSRVARTGNPASDRLRAAHVTIELQKEIGQEIRERRKS